MLVGLMYPQTALSDQDKIWKNGDGGRNKNEGMKKKKKKKQKRKKKKKEKKKERKWKKKRFKKKKIKKKTNKKKKEKKKRRWSGGRRSPWALQASHSHSRSQY